MQERGGVGEAGGARGSTARGGGRGLLLLGGLWGLSLLGAGCGPGEAPGHAAREVAAQQAPVVYGEDDRLDVYAHPDATLRERARQSTVALMPAAAFDASNPDNVVFTGQPLGTLFNLCPGERFRDDPTGAWCSGTLIDDDLVLTAGHCITNDVTCSNTRFVFRYYRTAEGALETVTTEDIFRCASIVVRQQAVVNGRNLDFAVVRLDRPATPRFTPAPVRSAATALPVGAPLAVIGSGSGIPFKVDAGGTVRDARASTLDYFVATTDTFGGNSGSGVYELDGYTLAGILVRGEADYILRGSCRVVKVCALSGCSGESINYVRPALDAYCQVAGSERLCGSVEPPPLERFPYSASDTDGATRNTTNRQVTLTAGQTLQAGTCGMPGAGATGDTFLRLYGPSGQEVAANDDACGGRGSNLRYTVPAGAGGTYEVRAGCYGAESCGGTVVYSVR